MIKFMVAPVFAVSWLFWAQSAHAEDSETLRENAEFCYSTYYAARENPSLSSSVESEYVGLGNQWLGLDLADFAARVDAVAPHVGGFASMAYTESIAEAAALNLNTELARNLRPAVLNAAVAKVSLCDQIYDIQPAVVGVGDQAIDAMIRLDSARTIPPEETVSCHLAYSAAKQSSIRNSPLGAIWANLNEYYPDMRLFEMELYADVVGAYSRVPANVSYPPADRDWSTRLPAALQANDIATQSEYIDEIARCDFSFSLPNALTSGPLMDPDVAHEECGARYNALIPFHAQAPQAQAYFQQRALYSGRIYKLIYPEKSDAEILQLLTTGADAKVKSYLKEDGTTDPQRLMEAFSEVRVCDQQYGHGITEIPETLYRAAKLDN